MDSNPLHRRRVLQLLGGAGFVALAGCASKARSGDATATTSTTGASTSPSGSALPSTASGKIPEETAGPFPGDGSNGVNVLTQNGIVRRDIRTSFGSASGTAAGIPSTITFRLVDTATGAALGGAAVYVWHCDREGRYSMYSDGATDQNYLRGVQETDAEGVATFTSIYPACYSGRWPHIHFEVYPTLADATAARNVMATSQIALTADVCNAVYATEGYDQSRSNLSQVSLATDMVFSDGVELETPAVSGSVVSGYKIQLPVRV